MRPSRYIPLIAVLAAVIAIIRARRPEPAPAAAPGSATWPPLDLPTAADIPAATADEVVEQEKQEEKVLEPAQTVAQEMTAPDEETPAWVEPAPDGSCPDSHPVKLNEPSGIFHVPEGQFYARTKAERCYVSPEAAEADGYRASRR